MMDAALGAVLPSLAGASNVENPAAHVRELGSTAGSVVDYSTLDKTLTSNARSAASQATGVQTVLTTAKQDAEFVKNVVARLIEQQLIPQLPSLANAKLVGREASMLLENVTRLDFRIRCSGHNWGAIGGNSDHIGTLSLPALLTHLGGWRQVL